MITYAMSLPYWCYRLLSRNLTSLGRRNYRIPSFSNSSKVLGIETSCDDTGCAVVDGGGNLLGEALYSQNAVHVRYGGVNPVVAYDFHRESIESAVSNALQKSKTTIDEVDAIAVTTKPGLLISLQVGVKYAKYLAKIYKKPLIPIHHMEAHALAARMYQNISFPFLVLLISGGDCLIAVAKDVTEFYLLGQTLDNAPGEVMDKAARRMKLKNMTVYSKVAGGHAIEMAAKKANNVDMFEFPLPLVRNRDCNFSFSGLKDSLVRKLLKKEEEHGIMGDEIIPEVYNLCAAFQIAITEHLIHRLDRAILFCEKNELMRGNKNIIVSGGVACNNFIFNSVKLLGNKLGYQVYRPPPRLCTDNGVMIAWNGIEKLKIQQGIVPNIELKEIEPVSPLGMSLINKVKTADLQIRVTRLKKLHA